MPADTWACADEQENRDNAWKALDAAQEVLDRFEGRIQHIENRIGRYRLAEEEALANGDDTAAAEARANAEDAEDDLGYAFQDLADASWDYSDAESDLALAEIDFVECCTNYYEDNPPGY